MLLELVGQRRIEALPTVVVRDFTGVEWEERAKHLPESRVVDKVQFGRDEGPSGQSSSAGWPADSTKGPRPIIQVVTGIGPPPDPTQDDAAEDAPEATTSPHPDPAPAPVDDKREAVRTLLAHRDV